MLPASSAWKHKPSNKPVGGRTASPAALLSSCFILVSCSTLKMETTYSSKMLVHCQRTARCYVPEDGTLHNHRWQNLKPCCRCVHLQNLCIGSGQNGWMRSSRVAMLCLTHRTLLSFAGVGHPSDYCRYAIKIQTLFRMILHILIYTLIYTRI